MSFVTLLLRHQAGLALQHVRNPAVGEMGKIVGRLCPMEFISCRAYLRSPRRSLPPPSQVVLHLRDFERCQQLARPHAISDIDRDRTDIPSRAWP